MKLRRKGSAPSFHPPLRSSAPEADAWFRAARRETPRAGRDMSGSRSSSGAEEGTRSARFGGETDRCQKPAPASGLARAGGVLDATAGRGERALRGCCRRRAWHGGQHRGRRWGAELPPPSLPFVPCRSWPGTLLL